MATTLARFKQSTCPALAGVRAKHCTAADVVRAALTGRRIAPLFSCERLGLGPGSCNTPSPVLRGAGNEPSHGRDIVAPPGNQAATENTNFCLHDGENPAYSPARIVLYLLLAPGGLHGQCRNGLLAWGRVLSPGY